MLHKNKLKIFESDPVLRVDIPQKDKRCKSLDILTLKNKYIQKLMLLIMEPYLEPCGDDNSFGFRPGKDQNQAVMNLARFLNVEKIKFEYNQKKYLSRSNIKNKKRKYCFTKYILSADIKNFFDNVSHN